MPIESLGVIVLMIHNIIRRSVGGIFLAATSAATSGNERFPSTCSRALLAHHDGKDTVDRLGSLGVDKRRERKHSSSNALRVYLCCPCRVLLCRPSAMKRDLHSRKTRARSLVDAADNSNNATIVRMSASSFVVRLDRLYRTLRRLYILQRSSFKAIYRKDF
jgi:hypothetical protein